VTPQSTDQPTSLTLADVRAAAERIRPYIHRTPVLTSGQLNARVGGSLFFKCENLQKTGSFKARGAHNAVFSLSAHVAAKGVVTHSSGNHAAALARAAERRGIPVTVVMPTNVSVVKKAAVASYGATIVECEPTLSARERAAARILAETGGTLVHPYDDFRVVAGQGTAALELLEQYPDLDLLLTPVGGGGLLAGSALVAKSLHAGIRVVGVEPELADDTYRSFHGSTRVTINASSTIADGLRGSIGERNLALLRTHVDDIVTVSEADIIAATRFFWERMKIVVEPSSAVPLAGILNGKIPVAGLRVGIIISGGNVDLDALPWVPGRSSL
jgi:threonine dehydratase